MIRGSIFIFAVLIVIQSVFYWFERPISSIPAFPRSLVWYLTMPGYMIFLFVPISPELLVRHPSAIILPILVNSYFYTTIFALMCLASKRMRKGSAA